MAGTYTSWSNFLSSVDSCNENEKSELESVRAKTLTSGGDMSVDHSWLEEEERKRERERKRCKTMEPDTTKRF